MRGKAGAGSVDGGSLGIQSLMRERVVRCAVTATANVNECAYTHTVAPRRTRGSGRT
jgi:hypothetical protein